MNVQQINQSGSSIIFFVYTSIVLLAFSALSFFLRHFMKRIVETVDEFVTKFVTEPVTELVTEPIRLKFEHRVMRWLEWLERIRWKWRTRGNRR
jgi:hypothetical protein